MPSCLSLCLCSSSLIQGPGLPFGVLRGPLPLDSCSGIKELLSRADLPHRRRSATIITSTSQRSRASGITVRQTQHRGH
uniref:Secreted protein n=1 Tax=Knipowitschia caucasica TaxID=637954 RepID=A0AAV2M8A0_KNICA